MREALLPFVATLATIALAGGVSLETYERPTECPDTLNGTTAYVAHETDCTKYYSCSLGEKRLMQCPPYSPGQLLHFDPEMQGCNWPWETNCLSKSPDCSRNGYREAYPYNCGTYYECNGGLKIQKYCAPGELFDSEKKTCLPKEDAKCQVYKDTCPTGKLLAPVYLSHECSCNSYYECVDGEYVERWCPAGQNFDVNRRQCLASEKAVCDPKTNNKPHPTMDCPATGIKYIPHEADCGSYYECVDGVKYLKTCEDGLSFDEVRGMCSWPLSSDCSLKNTYTTQLPAPYLFDVNEEIAPRRNEFKCPLEELNKVHRVPHHCSASKFYACESGRMYLSTCPDGMVYDYVIQSCSDPNIVMFRKQKPDAILNRNVVQPATCPLTGRSYIAHETNCALYYVCTNGDRSDAQSCYKGLYFNPLIGMCDLKENTVCHTPDVIISSTTTEEAPDNSCSMSDTKCRLYPDRCNCGVYAQCEDNRIVNKLCPGNLYFDDTLQTCNLPENVQCKPDCSNTCEEGELVPHECQCEKYYKCHNGKQYLEVCPAGKLFDSVRKHCVEASDNVHCGSDVPDNDCIGTCPANAIDYLPHKDCKKYCICSDGDTEVEECPGWSVYDRAQKRCDWPENVSNLTCDPFPCLPNDDSTNIPHECQCSLFYVCVNGTKHREHCEDGYYFDYVKQVCVDSGAHCYRDPETDDAKKCKETCQQHHGSSSLISHENCTKYCKCADRSRHVYSCPDGQFFDESRRICDWYENIKHLPCNPYDCGPKDQKVIPHECDCEIYYQCNGTDKIRTVCDDGLHYDYILGECVQADPHCMRQYSEAKGVETDRCLGTCPRQNSTSFLHLPHEDCTQYCVCSEGRPFIVKCAEGLHYNEHEQICTSPETADCEAHTKNASFWSAFADKFNFA